MAELDQLNVATERYIRDTPALVDNVFQADPLLAYLKLNVREDFPGGTLIQEGFINMSNVKRRGNAGNNKPSLIDLKAEMPTRANQMELLLAWAAGFIDGEGCVSVTESKPSSGGNRQFQCVINASQSKRAPLDRLKEILGGSVGPLRDEYGGCWQWRVYGGNALRAAQLLLPYVVYKRRQLELLIEFQLTKNAERWKDVPLAIHVRRAEIHAELRTLNARRKRLDAERLSEKAPSTGDDAIVRTDAKNEVSEADGNVRPASVN